MLKSSLRMIYGRYHEFVGYYGQFLLKKDNQSLLQKGNQFLLQKGSQFLLQKGNLFLLL
jgi:hypothetical protein